MNFTDERGVHDGHRARMRAKLAEHGQRIFDTYELLEMLLYHAIPRGDVNPLAKRLLFEFGSLDGVLSASREELMTVGGVGECVASLITAVGDMLAEGELSRFYSVDSCFLDYSTAGEFAAKYMNERNGLSVVCFMLDGCMQLLDTVELYDVDFGSAAVRSRQFIDRAVISGATLVIFAYARPHGAAYMLPCDRATAKMLAADLAAVGVRVVEHYVIAGSSYHRATTEGFVRLQSDSEELARFILSREAARNE